MSFRIKTSVVLLALFVAFTSFNMPERKTEEGGIKWMTFEEAVAANKVAPKKIFIDLYTDWCGWCKVMDKKTFSVEAISSYVNANYYAVKFNAEQKEDVIFDGHTFKFVASGRNGYHELAATLTQGKLSYPMGVFMDEEMRILTLLPGFQEAKFFDTVIKYFGENGHKKVSWEEWQKSYQSNL
ncbi:MAG: thioredoxin family protein [Imperialibacter sp.]|uniref:thioredoxin family protein n=1 Tax=Imperialibacter sp. TaxID=2038411 RepID=UPI0030D6EE08|tara:strand:+ start:14376 stop:14924 length:549 start_codon:yes stop_codon:yes gene_type:complete